MATAAPKSATIYRMVMPEHTCPYGLKAKDLLRRQGYEVEDHWLRTREETDAFKAKHGVKTTPQTFIGGERVGGYDDLRRFFGKTVRDPKAVTYRPVIAVFEATVTPVIVVTRVIATFAVALLAEPDSTAITSIVTVVGVGTVPAPSVNALAFV